MRLLTHVEETTTSSTVRSICDFYAWHIEPRDRDGAPPVLSSQQRDLLIQRQLFQKRRDGGLEKGLVHLIICLYVGHVVRVGEGKKEGELGGCMALPLLYIDGDGVLEGHGGMVEPK